MSSTSSHELLQLQKFDITPQQLSEWEAVLGISVPKSPTGEKLYTRQHVNLFRNVKKHLTLGRNLEQIKGMIELPAAETARVSVGEALDGIDAVQAYVPYTTFPLKKGLDLEGINVLDAFSPFPTFSVAPTASAEVQQEAALESMEGMELALQLEEAAAAMTNVAQVETLNETASLMQESLQAPQESISLEAALAESTAPPQDLWKAGVQTTLEAFSKPLPPQIAPKPVLPMVEAQAAPLPLLQTPSASAATAAHIIDKVLADKESLQRKLIEAEKLNSHLYSVNNLFNKKVKELTSMVHQLKEANKEDRQMQLLSEKSELQRQLLSVERRRNEGEQLLLSLEQQVAQKEQERITAETKVAGLTAGFDATAFMGTWVETLALKEVVFDNFGLNVEQERQQLRVVEQVPQRIIGNAAFFSLRYSYPDNPVWQRLESLSLVALGNGSMQGELSIDYLLDGVPVCRALYTASLQRQG